jgi:hypothetical protein
MTFVTSVSVKGKNGKYDCYMKRTTDNVLQILLQASRWRVKTANTILTNDLYIYIYINYTLYKNAGFWLVNSHDIFLQIQALHCEFDNVSQILLQASRWRVKTANTILQIPWKKVKSYANTPTWSKNSANS